ncbi:MAG: carboxypeptidase regulatory-like domain-containing protein, partial [Candidatus Hydrogenedentes bacterium]|nr:carboxypeptidase regulatory-like domain-containing protein [Candidatus Hydrogenedentota bacterium]
MRHLAFVVILMLAGFTVMAHAESVTIQGVVTGPEEKPVEGAQVWLCQDRQVEKTETDAQGRFSFAV